MAPTQKPRLWLCPFYVCSFVDDYSLYGLLQDEYGLGLYLSV